MNQEDMRLLELTPAGRQAVARRRTQEAADGPATFAGAPPLDAANRGRRDGSLAGTRSYHMGDGEPDDTMMDVMAKGACVANGGAVSDAARAAYTSTYAAAHRVAYRAARAKGKPQGPDGDPAARRKLLAMTAAGRQALAREAKG